MLSPAESVLSYLEDFRQKQNSPIIVLFDTLRSFL